MKKILKMVGATALLVLGLTATSCSTKVKKEEKPSETEEVKYSITFNTNGGSSVASTTGSALPTTLPTPTKSGYTFEGWYTNSTLTTKAVAGAAITANTTLYAKWVANSSETTMYTITYNTNGGSSVASTTGSVLPTTLPTPTKSGYTFEGWYTNSNLTTKAVAGATITANTTLYAKWLANSTETTTYTITYNTNGGSSVASTTGSSLPTTLPTTTKSGYTFEGWYTNSNLTTKAVAGATITANTTLYAKWVANSTDATTYTITYNNNGYGETPSSLSGVTSLPSTLPTLDDEGYTFKGWYKDSEFYMKAIAGSTISANTALYAKWVKNSTVEGETVIAYSGYDEGAYVTFNDTNAASASVSYYNVKDNNVNVVDKALIRQETSKTARVDILGLTPGTYNITITTSGGEEATINNVVVYETDRSGYAHYNYTSGVGAYNDDGSLKTGAVVVYVTDENKNTVTATINKKTYTGLAAIMQAQKNSKVALCIRIIGTIKSAQWNSYTYSSAVKSDALIEEQTTHLKKSSWSSSSSISYEEIIKLGINSMSNDIANGITFLEGLTNKIMYSSGAFDSYYNDLDVKEASNITVEGVGTDAGIFQWGFTFSKCNSIEVRNLTFDGYTEDALGFQGSSNTDLNYGNYWVHNNTFNIGTNNWDVSDEQDKGDGDGTTDFKRCHNVTISYNIYNKTHKTTLVGADDACLQYNLTLHHNYYKECKSRLPLLRQANVHMYNNYYYKCSTAQDIRANAFAFSEANYFDSCTAAQNVTLKSKKISDSTHTIIKSYNDVYNGSKNETAATKVSSRTETLSGLCKPDGSTDYTNFDINSKLFYYNSTKKVTDVMYLTTAEVAKNDAKTYAGALKDQEKYTSVFND